MKIEEAIKELKDTLDARRSYLTIAEKKAIQLGIEALERLQTARKVQNMLILAEMAQGKLPSETEE